MDDNSDKKTRGPPATTHSHLSETATADMQMAYNIFSTALMTRQWLQQFLRYLAYKVNKSWPAGYILYCNIFIIKKIKMK